MASIRNFFKPGRETLLEHPREYIIFVRCGFKLIVTLISNLMTKRRTFPCRRRRRPEKTGSWKYSLKPAISLAYWFTDDGESYTKNQKRYNFLNTQYFIFDDQSRLVQALEDNFSGLMAATIQKDRSYYILYIRSKSTNRFVNLIRPYLNPCFDSKIQ